MSEKKFNLKTYQKIDGGEHIDMRLKETRKEAPDVINEKQLESYRGTEANVVVEKLLEQKRTGEDTEITEKRLDTHDAKFANKYRNPAAHEGDMNKLEEQRLQGDPVEKEKYELASKTSEQFRWWEGVKSPDGLKLAKNEKDNQKKNIIARKKRDVEFEEPQEKTEEMTFDKPRWQEMGEYVEEKEEKDPVAISDVPEDFSVIENKSLDLSKEMFVKKEKYLPNKNPNLSAVYIVLSFDPSGFSGNEDDIKQAALEKVLTIKPELSGLISIDNFGEINEDAGEGTIKLRAFGEEFDSIVRKTPANAVPSAIKPDIELSEETMPIEEISYEEKDMEGTPTAIGRVTVNTSVTTDNRDSIIEDVIKFVRNKHPNIEVEVDSLDLSDIDQGEIRYMVGVMDQEEEPLAAESNFNIIVESALKKN